MAGSDWEETPALFAMGKRSRVLMGLGTQGMGENSGLAEWADDQGNVEDGRRRHRRWTVIQREQNGRRGRMGGLSGN
jgi:hypothetical protein